MGRCVLQVEGNCPVETQGPRLPHSWLLKEKTLTELASSFHHPFAFLGQGRAFGCPERPGHWDRGLGPLLVPQGAQRGGFRSGVFLDDSVFPARGSLDLLQERSWLRRLRPSQPRHLIKMLAHLVLVFSDL